MASPPDNPAFPFHAAWMGVSAAFAALGRVFVCVDHEFRVIHASWTLDDVLGDGAAVAAEGRPLEELMGDELFGPGGTLRAALLAGERREGWRATVSLPGREPHLTSLTAAPMAEAKRSVPPGVCDPRVAYIVVLRPTDDDPAAVAGAPTAFSGLIARSAAMLRIFGLIENLHHTDATVLLTGESGTGKELVARAIHEQSDRRKGPFVAVNCGALPGDLLESEMFGYARGAFTGAVRDRQGRFELASDGTLFLDEVADLPLPLQVKLLRVLQEHTFERLGESVTRRTEARIVAATNADLRRAVSLGHFRDDLYYRLRVVPIEIPPLRERREDIEPLSRHLLARVGQRNGRALRLSPAAMRVLIDHPWPGNVRELENALEYAVAVCSGQTVLPEHLPDEVRSRAQGPSQPPIEAEGPPSSPRASAPLAGEEAEELRRVLDRHRWRRADAARALGISRTTLWRRMREAGLER